MIVHADKRVSEINQELVSVGPKAALSELQKEQLHTLLTENFQAISDIKKGEGSDDEKAEKVVAKRKELWAKIRIAATLLSLFLFSFSIKKQSRPMSHRLSV